MVGSTISFALLIWGIVHCVRIMRRHTTHSLCVAGLMVFLIGWFGSTAVSAAMAALELPKVVMVFWGLILFLINCTALVLAIVGLSQFDRARFVQGRKQAIWAIVLSGLSLLGMIGAFAVGFYKQVGGALTTSSPTRKELPLSNCVVTAPVSWINVDPKLLGSNEAALTFRKFAPEMYMALVPEELGEATTLQDYVEAVKMNLASGSEVKEQQEESVTVRGLEFRRIMSSTRLLKPSLELYYEQWLATQGGMFWQMNIWGAVKNREAIAVEARKFVDAFEVLDHAKTSPSTGTLTDVKKPEWGFAAHLANEGWQPGKGDLQANPLFRFTAQRPYEALVVLPLRFEETPPDLDSIARGLLSTLDFAYPFTDGSNVQTESTPHGEELRITTEREVKPATYSYSLRVVRGDHIAYLIAGWAQKQKGDMARVLRAMDAIELFPSSSPTPEPGADERKALKTIFNETGLNYIVRKEYDAAAQWFQRSYQQTKNDATILDNWAFSLQNAGKAKEALALIEPEISRYPKAFGLQTRRSYLLAATGKIEEAQSHFVSLIDAGLKDEEELLPWLNRLVELERHDLAEATAIAWNKKQPSMKTRRWEAQVIASSGDAERAVAVMEKLLAEKPDDEPTLQAYGKMLNQAGDYTKAGEVAERMLAKSPQKLEPLRLLGWSQMGRRFYREAKATFERASKVRPQDDDIQEGLRNASAALGQGNNSDVKTPLTPVPLPAVVSQELNKIKPADTFGRDKGAIVLSRSTGYAFEKDKALRQTIRRKIKVLNSAGVDSFSSMEFPFDPLGERIYLNRLEVLDETGKMVATGSVDDCYVRDTPGDLATHRKTLHVQVPGLRQGYVVDVEVTTEDRDTEETFPFTRHLFAYRLPCVSDAVYITGDTSLVQSVISKAGPVKMRKEDHLLAWFVQEQPVRESEPFSSSIESTVPVLWLGDNRRTWSDIGRKYLEQIADRLKPDPEIEKVADELCHGLKSEKEKISALTREVQKAISYKAIEFGVRARRPNAPTDTLRQRFGDCKDHSLLLHQLLYAAKIESHLTLVHTDNQIQPDLPSLDQFNHMVIHVPSLGKDWLIDPTDKYLGLATLPASGLWDSHALVLDPSGPKLFSPVAKVREGSADVGSRRTISVEGNDWLVDETLTLSGYYGAWIRGSFANQTTDEQLQRAQSILSQNNPVEIKEFRFENLDDLAQPARLTMTYRVKNAVRGTTGKLSAILPALWERDYLGLNYVQNRTTPFKFRYPFRFTSDITVKLPATATMGTLAKRSKGTFADWELAVSKPSSSGDGWRIRSQFRAQTGEWPAKEYAALYDAWDSARRAWDTNIEWRAP